MNPLVDIEELAAELLQRGWMLATAESCTGGMIAARCTDLAGSSQWFERGFVSYSNDAKHEMLGVPTELIEKHGAVSEVAAQAMAIGALNHSKAQVAVAVTALVLVVVVMVKVVAAVVRRVAGRRRRRVAGRRRRSCTPSATSFTCPRRSPIRLRPCPPSPTTPGPREGTQARA